MIQFFARHPTAANLIMLTFVLLGVLGLADLQRETFPEFAADKVTVSVVYPGASAQTIDESIVQRIEDAVDGTEYLDRMTASVCFWWHGPQVWSSTRKSPGLMKRR